MTIPVEIVAAVLGVMLASLLGSAWWVIRRILALDKKLALVVLAMEDHLGILLPKGDTEHFRIKDKPQTRPLHS